MIETANEPATGVARDEASRTAETPSGWARNRAWLPAAAVLGVLAFALPWHINQRELDRSQARNPIKATATGWSEYEGARWRIVGVRRERARAGSAAEYQHPEAALLLIDYEVMPGPAVDARRLDQCKGRVVDAGGREWEANMPPTLSTRMARRGIGVSCGSRVVGEPDAAVAGRPFAFTHVFLVPTDAATHELRADIVFPPSTTRPNMGTYLRFDLAPPQS